MFGFCDVIADIALLSQISPNFAVSNLKYKRYECEVSIDVAFCLVVKYAR
jgi:hypothetical protein